jgi:hypothetical protein
MGYYFGPHLSDYNQQIMDLRRRYAVVESVRQLPESAQVYLIFDDALQIPLIYAHLKYLGDSHDFRVVNISEVDSLDRDAAVAFFVDQRHPEDLAALAAVWELDGPYFGDTTVPVAEQYALYKTIG